jgi:NhaA family Na+:H+ antiporter
MWAAVLESGIHATLAGVITALMVPVRCRKNPEFSPCKHMEHALHPWVAYMVLPVFAFANAGVPLGGVGLKDLMDPAVMGIAGGLFLGKQVGVFGILWLTIITGLSPKPQGANWFQLYAVALLCGVGFTMSLFIGGLAYEGIEMQAAVRKGVLIGSITSALAGYLILRYGPTNQNVKTAAPTLKKHGSLPI